MNCTPLAERRGLLCRLSLMLAFFVAVVSSLYPEQNAIAQVPEVGSVTLDQIVAEWRQRSNEARTVRIVFDVKDTNFYGSPEMRLNPPRDLKYEDIEPYVTRQRVDFRFDTDRTRLTEFNADQKKVESDASYDGKVARTLLPETHDRGETYPYGMTRALERFQAYPYQMPPIWFYRMTSPKFRGIEFEHCELTDRSGVIEGKNCVILLERPPEGRAGMRENEYWLAPELDFAVLRYVRKRLGKTIEQLDIDYRQDGGDLEPTGWRWTTIDPLGRPERESKCKVSRLETNLLLPDDEFSLVFPFGAVVRDLDQKESYIVRADSERRVITDEEKTAKYSQALNSESGMALKPKPASKTLLIVGVIVLLVVGAMCLVVWRRRTK